MGSSLEVFLLKDADAEGYGRLRQAVCPLPPGRPAPWEGEGWEVEAALHFPRSTQTDGGKLRLQTNPPGRHPASSNHGNNDRPPPLGVCVGSLLCVLLGFCSPSIPICYLFQLIFREMKGEGEEGETSIACLLQTPSQRGSPLPWHVS